MAIEHVDVSDELVKKPNPAVLAILDPLHRSLLNNNLQYELVSRRSSSDDDQSTVQNDSDQYFTATVSTDSATDCDAIVKTHKSLDANQIDNDGKDHRQLNQMQHATTRKNTDFTHDSFNNSNHSREKVKHQLKRFEQTKSTAQHCEQLNVLDTENRCDTIHQSNASNSKQQRRLSNARAWSKSHEQITHKFSRRSTRNSLENKAPLSSCCHHRANENYSYNTKRSKRLPATNNNSDSSDINSETNLIIENMRNRECEMYRKISFNNGYFDTTDSSSTGGTGYTYCSRHNSSTVESTSVLQSNKCKNCAGYSKRSPKFKRKCRSFPLTENRQTESNNRENVIQMNQQTSRFSGVTTQTNRNNTIIYPNNEIGTGTETNTFQTNSRKITITIKSNARPMQIDTTTQTTQPSTKSIEQYLTNTCETSEESDTTVSDCATLWNENEPNTNQIVRGDEQFNEFRVNECENDDCSSDDNSFFSIKSDIECQSESSQYFNCASFTELSNDNLNSIMDNKNIESNDEPNPSNIKQVRKKMVKQHMQRSENTQTHTKNVTMQKTAPMICIEQELCENRIVTSKIEVDKEKIREFKERRKNGRRPKIIIDNTFSEEILNEALNRSVEIHCNKTAIDDIVSSLESNKCIQNHERLPTKCVKSVQNVKQKFISDGFVFDKLEASPKYTGKSINRLLAHRIEQQSITSVRRTLLHNVAYAITEKDRIEKIEKKKFNDLAPIKPPRSFTASSSCSPLSKQSIESSATVPISELNGNEQHKMDFVFPPAYHTEPRSDVGEESSVQFGWIRPSSNVDNNDPPMSRYTTADQYSQTNSTAKYQTSSANSPQPMGFCLPPKENIDTVDCSVQSNKDFEHFSTVLMKSPPNNLSTPMKDTIDSKKNNDTQFFSIDEVITKSNKLPTPTIKSSEMLCKNCHCQVKKEKSQHVLLGKTGKRIGKAAIKRTKTLIGTSRNFLKKPITKPTSSKPINKTNDEIFSTPLKDGDNTVCNNRDIISPNTKCMDKSLNLTPKEHNVVNLNPSPQRNANISNVRLLRDAPKQIDSEKNDSEAYITPDEMFDFDRVVKLPNEKSKSIKRSPSKIIMKWAKSSTKLFQKKNIEKDKKHENSEESPHYYKSNDYDEVDNKVLLMGEMLSNMRKRIENGHGSNLSVAEEIDERPSTVKKCLFRNRTISTSSGDLLDQASLVEQIATIDLHDEPEPEPEPLYAEIELAHPIPTFKRQDTMYQSCIDDDDDDVNAIKSCNTNEPIDLKEVYISDRADSQPSKYIMVNNNPKILYATVNRNSMHARSLETIESKTELSDDQTDDKNIDKSSVRLTSSYESLDMSLINDFATAVQTELDECQFKMSELFTTATSDPNQTGIDEVDAIRKCDRKSNASSESTAISDLNSGCSSFYRRNKNIVSNRPRKGLSDFVDTLSFDTVGTGSYCESLSRGNDVNSEIKDTITSLEYMPGDMSDLDSFSRDFTARSSKFRLCLEESDTSKESTKFHSLNRQDSIESSPTSSLYRTFGKGDSPSRKLKKMSPSLKSIKTKFRNSFRIDSRKTIHNKNESFNTANFGLDETLEVKSFASTSSSENSADLERKKMFESICSRFELMPNRNLANDNKMKTLIDKIRQQQAMRKSIQNALDVCRTNGEFHNSRELVEAEQLMLMSSLKECTALEKLITLWQNNNDTNDTINELGEGVLIIKYLEFELNANSMFETHYNFFYVCVCSYNDQVEFTDAKERKGNRISFNNLKMHFVNLMADFEIRVEIYVLRLRKNAPIDMKIDPYFTQCNSSRFRLQGKTLLTSTNLSRKHVSPTQLQHTSNDQFVYRSCGLISPAIVLSGQINTLCDSLKIGYQEQLFFNNSKANGFLNLADSKQKWDRLWCRIDQFSMHFWKYPQDSNDAQTPILTLNLDQCNYHTKSLLVDREICPRPRTFKIDVIHSGDSENGDRTRCVQSYFISAENQLDLELWLSEIQKIFDIIKSWNI